MYTRNTLFIGNLFLAISATLINYTLLPYLSPFMSETNIGFALAGGGAVATIGFIFLPMIVKRWGAQRPALILTLLEMVMLFAVAEGPSTIMSAVLVVLALSIQPLIIYQLDLLLEATVDNEDTTGRVRTLFLTGWNIGSLVAPLLIGTLLANSENYTYIFLAAAAALVPFIVLFAIRRLPERDILTTYRLRDTLAHIAHDRDLAAVTAGHFVLYLFYIWAPLYIPVYLHTVLGIPWTTLGWMFSVMLVPYILIEYPAGWLSDRMFGDKEMMLTGFILAGGALAAMSFITATTAPLIILTILVTTRAGAALIESMTEGHFFRRVSEKDIVSVSVFRGVWPLADAIAPIIGATLLFFGSFQSFFIITGGFVIIAGTISTLLIRDFR